MTEKDGVFSRLSLEQNVNIDLHKEIKGLVRARDGFQSANNILIRNSDNLLKELAKIGEELNGAIVASINWENRYVILSEDEITINTLPDSLDLHFDRKIGSLNIGGTILSPPLRISLDVRRDPLEILAAITEVRKGLYRTYLTFSDPDIKVSNIETRFKPFARPLTWKEKLRGLFDINVGIFANREQEMIFYGGLRVNVKRFSPQIRIGNNGLWFGTEINLY